MDDGCCAVCAETLEWVAYGPCGHRDVCALCVARLRFVCHHRRCCICNSLSPSVFITRALGSLTRVINDFSILPSDTKDGKVGSYWYHEDTQAYFDDFDEYKIIKAMCKLSCSVCDKLEAEGEKSSKRKGKFKSVELLKDHLSHQHELFLCNLCLEYKKVFICEQKLYSRVQLRQHIRYGDSEVDGCKNERCGFSGHPLCEFCQRPFYGDNELYFHMSTEHYTCHICQRQHSTQYEYYKDYNELENHFREAHYLCEDDACLEKKFIVFLTEADMKRHSALEHGGNMSRSKCRTALQLPTCFHRREREEECHRVRAHVYFPSASNRQLSSAGSANVERTSSNLLHAASSFVQAIPSHRGTREIDATASTISSSGQSQGSTLDFRGVLLNGSDFPRLPRSSKRRQRKSKKKSEETGTNHTPVSSSSQSRSSNAEHLSHPNPYNSSQIGPLTVGQSSSSSVNSYNLLTPISNDIASASSANSWTNSIEDVGPSSSAPNLISEKSTRSSASMKSTLKGEDIQAANKSLVEKIFVCLNFDKDKYAAFKIISKEFCEGDSDAGEYLAYVHQFGLSHLVSDLARLCPDPQKKKELMEIHKSFLGASNKNEPKKESGNTNAGKDSQKRKEKCIDSGGCSKGKTLPDSIADKFEELKLNAKPEKEESSSSKVVEHHADRKSKTLFSAKLSEIPSAESQSLIEDVAHWSGSGSNANSATGGKRKMKKSKFHKTRLGDDCSASAVPDSNCSDLASGLMVVRPNQDSILASVRGVWRNDGGRRLVAMSSSR